MAATSHLDASIEISVLWSIISMIFTVSIYRYQHLIYLGVYTNREIG